MIVFLKHFIFRELLSNFGYFIHETTQSIMKKNIQNGSLVLPCMAMVVSIKTHVTISSQKKWIHEPS